LHSNPARKITPPRVLIPSWVQHHGFENWIS
jgi:hypothetical protein